MISIQFVNPISAHLGRKNNSLADEASKASTNPNFRSPGCLRGDLTNCEGPSGPGEYRQNRTVQCRDDRPCRISEVHYHKV